MNACISKEDTSLIPELTSTNSNTRSLDEANKIASSDFWQILGNSKSRINGESKKIKSNEVIVDKTTKDGKQLLTLFSISLITIKDLR